MNHMKYLSAFAALSAVALLGVGCFSPPAPPAVPPSTPPEPSSPPATSAMWAEANGVVALDQRPGSTVIVSSLIVEQNGWVAIHKDAGGKPGPYIGETYVKAGEHSNVTVNLREATKNGETYYAMLHVDDGDNVFVIAKDTPVQSRLGGVIMAGFEATSSAGDLPEVMP